MLKSLTPLITLLACLLLSPVAQAANAITAAVTLSDGGFIECSPYPCRLNTTAGQSLWRQRSRPVGLLINDIGTAERL